MVKFDKTPEVTITSLSTEDDEAAPRSTIHLAPIEEDISSPVDVSDQIAAAAASIVSVPFHPWRRGSVTKPGETLVDAVEPGPAVDRGRDAWLVLAAAFILQGSVPGFSFAFGVFQEYYSNSPDFPQAGTTNIAAIGTLAMGIWLFAAPFMYAFFRRFPSWRKPIAIIGLVMLLVSLVAASFANTIQLLLATQGVLFAIGGSLLFYPTFLYLDEWWITRKGFAYGVVWSGSCSAGVAIPLIMQWLLDSYGFRTALRVWAIASFILIVPALSWLKPRLPTESRREVQFELRYLKCTTFWILQFGSIAASLAFTMPNLYLPSFAAEIGVSPLVGTVAISLMNAANIVGSTLVGIMTDKHHVTVAINICTIGTVVAVFLFWAFATSTPMLLIFAMLFGVFAGGYSATWAGCADPLRTRGYHNADTGMVVSLFQAGKGIGSLLASPISGALLAGDMWKGKAPWAFGSGYGSLIVFTGVVSALSMVGWVGKRAGYV